MDYWTTERVERLTELWDKGLSIRKIADVMGDLTHNAVIGKARRLKLAPRRTCPRGAGAYVKKRKPTVPKRRPFRPKRIVMAKPAPPPKPVEPTPLMLTVMQLDSNTCRFPYGELATGIRFCGNPCVGTYCAYHRTIVFEERRR